VFDGSIQVIEGLLIFVYKTLVYPIADKAFHVAFLFSSFYCAV
jgi:hypothetical protein